MSICPVCGKPLKVWYQLGGTTILSCSDILCRYKPGYREIKIEKPKKEEKKGINKWI